MLYLALFILILILVIIVTTFIQRFSLVRVRGVSMSPTFRNNQLLFVDRFKTPQYRINFGDEVQVGTIIVYRSPSDSFVIKRLTEKVQVSDSEFYYWFEGDNKDESFDSRNYGFIQNEAIIGEVINFRTFLKRTFTFN